MKAYVIFTLLIALPLSAVAQSVIIFTTKRVSSPSGSVTVREWHADTGDLTAGPKWDGVGTSPFDEPKLQEIARNWCSYLYPDEVIGDLRTQRRQRAESVEEGHGWFYIYYFEVLRSATNKPGWISPPADPVVILSSGKPVIGSLKRNKPNQTPEPTPTAVTSDASASAAPSAGAAHLRRSAKIS